MAAYPWMTSRDLINSVKRKISFPINQATFTEKDILAFASEELMISQVPNVMMYHEEYFVYTVKVPLQSDVLRYAIPDRSIGMKLRDLSYEDSNKNLFEMTRIPSEEKSFYQRSNYNTTRAYSYYIEGNEIVLTPGSLSNPTGSLAFYIFLRPNQLVANERAAIANYFTKTVTLTSVIAGDTVTVNDIVFTAVSGTPSANQFQIGTDVATASSLAAAINTNGIALATNQSSTSNVVSIKFLNQKYTVAVSNATTCALQVGAGIEFNQLPSTYTDPITNETDNLFVAGNLIDFLQTKPGHRIYKYDIAIGNNAISGTTLNFPPDTIPVDFIIGDYICLANESIIPQIPPDLHNVLAERTCSRILAAIGDIQGLGASAAKIQDMEQKTGTLVDSRVEGAPLKITGRHSVLRYQKSGFGRRW